MADDLKGAPAAPVDEVRIDAALDAIVCEGETVRFYLEQANPVSADFDEQCQGIMVREIMRCALARAQLDASETGPAEGWTLIAPDGMRFSGASPLRAASAAARHGIQTDPVKAKHFHDAIASLQAENDAENQRLMELHGTLNCPACGGSGHIGDVATPTAQSKPQEDA